MLRYNKEDNEIIIFAIGSTYENVTTEAVAAVFEWFIKNKENGEGVYIIHKTKPYLLRLEEAEPVFEKERG